jgi:hypothetical protein
MERPAQDKSKAPPVSRRQKMKDERKDQDYEPDMPPAEGVGYLLGYLWEVGPTMAAGMGAGPVTHTELRAWQANTGIELAPWEARILRRLSHDYLAESHAAEKPDRAAPWQAIEVVIDHAAVAERMKQSIRNMMKE